MNETEIRSELSFKRDEWRQIRRERLSHKNYLMELGHDIKFIRKDKKYKLLKKKQQHLFKVIKHIEKKINRIIKNNDR